MELNREHYKAYVYIEFKCYKSATDIIAQLKTSRLNGIPGESTVYLWLKDFKDGKRTSLLDAPRSGRPCLSSTVANVNAIHDLIELDPKQSTRCIS